MGDGATRVHFFVLKVAIYKKNKIERNRSKQMEHNPPNANTLSTGEF